MPSSNTSAEVQLGHGALSLPPRLNPFAFVSDTSLRFALLLVLIVVASGIYWIHVGGNWTYTGIASNVVDPQEEFDACLQGSRVIGPAMFQAEQNRLGLACVGRYAAPHV